MKEVVLQKFIHEKLEKGRWSLGFLMTDGSLFWHYTAWFSSIGSDGLFMLSEV